MTVLTSVLIIAIAAAGGWLIASLFILILFRPSRSKNFPGFSIIGILPSIRPELGNWIAAAIQKELLSAESIEKRIDDPALMAELRPEIEQHIDTFLRDKLKVAFPLLAGLMGEKTLATLKVAFLAEVEIIFPSVMKKISTNLFQKWQPRGMIQNKLDEVNLEEVERTVRAKAYRQIFFFKLMGALGGALIGILQVLIFSYFG